jgi:predicted nucleic acid-binding protein
VATAFVDSGAWIALMVPEDRYHSVAIRTFRSLSRGNRLITSNYVVSETATWLLYRNRRRAAFALRDMLNAGEQQGFISVVWVTEREHDAGWTVVQRYQDQRLSFPDATSIAIATERKVDFVFGFDQHFRVAGLDLRPGT